MWTSNGTAPVMELLQLERRWREHLRSSKRKVAPYFPHRLDDNEQGDPEAQLCPKSK